MPFLVLYGIIIRIFVTSGWHPLITGPSQEVAPRAEVIMFRVIYFGSKAAGRMSEKLWRGHEGTWL